MKPKFRAWHKSDRKMYEVYGHNHDKWFLKGKRTPMPLSAIKLMQYTGLKDKNGVEIYEGDIVSIRFYFGGHPFGGIPHVIQRSKYNNELIAEQQTDQKYIEEKRLDFNRSEDYEIIGNVYEDSHLLEESAE